MGGDGRAARRERGADRRHCAAPRRRAWCRGRRRGSRWRSARASRAATARRWRRCRCRTAVVLMQRGHEYKYARCATLAGARVEWVDDIAGALGRGRGGDPPSRRISTAPRCRSPSSRRWRGRPACRSWSTRRTSASRWRSWGGGRPRATSRASRPSTSGGRTPAGSSPAGRASSRDVAALDFTGYESGPWRTFGRRFKLDRATVAATVCRAGGVDRGRSRRALRRLRGARCGAARSAARGLPGARIDAQAVHARRALRRRTGQRRRARGRGLSGAGARGAATRASARSSPAMRSPSALRRLRPARSPKLAQLRPNCRPN